MRSTDSLEKGTPNPWVSNTPILTEVVELGRPRPSLPVVLKRVYLRKKKAAYEAVCLLMLSGPPSSFSKFCGKRAEPLQQHSW